MWLFVTKARLKKLMADETAKDDTLKKAYDEMDVYNPNGRCELCGSAYHSVSFEKDTRFGGRSYLWAHCTNCMSMSAYRPIDESKPPKKAKAKTKKK